MNNPNPFLPKGSLLEQQGQRRSRLKLAVFCVLAVSVTGLVAMLIQGCKREKPDTELNPPPMDLTNTMSMDLTNPPMSEMSNPPVAMPDVTSPPLTPLPPLGEPLPATTASAGSEYMIVQGDTLAVIAKKNGVSLSALQAANPGVVPTKLQIGQKIVIPPAAPASMGSAPMSTGLDAGVTIYTVKSGDTLTKIAKAHGSTVKAIQKENGMVTTGIKVGQKLKIPAKAPALVPVPVVEPAPALEPAPMTIPAAPAPAPAR
jgi:LysM repeat protein